MNSIILQGINTDDLKRLLKEVIEENFNKNKRSKEEVKSQSYLTRFEVAEMLKISLPTLNNWSKSGIIQAYRIGNRVLYKPNEIDQAVQMVKNLKYKRG